ncbi:MAG: DUF2807 domain-containing protein [Flavobacteriaceae bacterium]|jgi:hypothetical protein|nr:DUF2807 domain-containing protein [Flavobacteriaceae bacterium]
MVRILIALAMSLLSFIMYGQGKQVVTISGGVQSLNVALPISVTIDASKDSDKVEIVTDNAVGAELIQVKQSGTKLIIGLKPSSKRTKNIGSIKINLSQKGIVNYEVSTVAKVVVNGRVTGDNAKIAVDATGSLDASFSVNTISINVDSAGKYIGNVVAKTMKSNVDSAGKVVVTGDVETLNVNVDSAASFDGKGLKAKYVKVEVDSMGKAEVYPTESLNAYADSMGKVIYHNTPKEIKKYTDSMGSVKAK